jgi:general secretion pathway protein M
MIEKLQQYLQQLSPRERLIVLGGAVLAVLLIITATVLPLQRRVSAASARVEQKRGDLIWLRSVGPQLAMLQVTRPATPASNESLVVLVDRTARESGLGKSLGPSQPSGDGALSVRIDKVPFDSLVAWLSQLHERYGISVESASVDRANEAGMVTATLVLRPG